MDIGFCSSTAGEKKSFFLITEVRVSDLKKQIITTSFYCVYWILIEG